MAAMVLVRMRKWIFSRKNSRLCVCVCVCIYMHTFLHIRVCVSYIYIYIYIYPCMCILYIYIHIYIYIYKDKTYADSVHELVLGRTQICVCVSHRASICVQSSSRQSHARIHAETCRPACLRSYVHAKIYYSCVYIHLIRTAVHIDIHGCT